MDWDDCRVLLEVHRSGSFLAAGEKLGLSASTVTRRIAALEQKLGRAVVLRTSRGVRVEREALGLLSLASSFELALTAHEREREGMVRVSVPEGFGGLAAQAAQRCQAQVPGVIVEVAVEARYVDLAAREADVALRGGRSASRVLIERRAGEVSVCLYASRAYWSAHLPSRKLARDSYARLHFIVDERLAQRSSPSRWLIERGATRFPFRSNSPEARLEAARMGLGAVVYASNVPVAGLEPVALDSTPPGITFYVAMHRELRKVPRMKAMADALVASFEQSGPRRGP